MRAAQMKVHPGFALMKQTDIQNVYYMQMPRWLFYDPRYAEMSLDAKVTYTFLLNRFQLSRRKGWINEEGEVFVIFPRKALAQELRICEKRVIAACHKLAELQLIWEKRCGRGDANQIYLAKVEEDGSRTAETTVLDAEETSQDLPYRQFRNGGSDRSRTAETAAPELPIVQPSNKETRKKENNQKEVSLSVTGPPGQDGRADDEAELTDILDGCELSYFSPEVARVFENAIERLFYLDSFRIGNATLPQKRVRARLRLLDEEVLRDAERKLASNLENNVRNSTAYVMATIFNCISENDSDLLVDPYLNSLRAPMRRC